MKTQTITDPVNGQRIPVTIELNIAPLTLMGKPIIDGRGEPVMNNRWVYVNMPGYGLKAINVYRAHYCEKRYLSEVTIQSSIGEKKLMSNDLKKFIEKVSNKIVFEKYGKWYRVYLRQITGRIFDIEKIVPYNWTIKPNMNFGGMYAHQCCIDWRSVFYIK